MSGLLKAFDLNKFKQKISLSTNHCLKYTRKASVSVNDIKQDGKLAKHSYVEILSAFLSKDGIKIKDDCERIDSLLRRCWGEIKSRCRKLQGRSKVEFIMKVKNLSIYRHEIVQVSHAEEKLKIAKDNLDTLSEGMSS